MEKVFLLNVVFKNCGWNDECICYIMLKVNCNKNYYWKLDV